MRLSVPGTMDGVSKAMSGLAAGDLFASLQPDLQQNVEIVLAEVMNNIVEHAYAACQGDITLVLIPQPNGLLCTVMDKGAAMPDLTMPKGKLQQLGRIDELPEGGFGWFLIRSLTQDLNYRHDAGVNLLSFRLGCEQHSG